ncbi:MAG TPA: phosphotransferase [Vicinamibacterales bacterium]|jgi:aminoglycoside/choline kinase family phosphotransferase|nr:phosphotransferase [Vicinamibacterales bacterium]
MTDNVRPRIDRYLSETGLADRAAKVVPLTGDASDRRYVRILLRDAPSQVLSVYPQAFDVEQLPFANVARLMAAMPVPVPAILGHSNELGILALEDLGDVTLQAHLGAATRAEHAALYRQAVTLIARMQQRGRDLTSDRYLPYGIAFDVEKLSWELQFFAKHFLEAYRGAVLTPAGREALGVELLRIAEELAAEPRVFCHRDYHSRNLMLHAGQLYIIDFQDARMGPDTYDLVSLLRDSYMDFSEREVDELIAFFLALRGVGADRGGAGMEAGLFRRRFDLMALQRNLKALGTFGFQTTTRGNPVYIQYIPRTIAYVRNNVERDARFWRLREILSAHLDELK